MNVSINQRYLALPVSWHAQPKKLTFLEAGQLVYELDVRIDPVGAQFTFYVDLRRFQGRTLEICCAPEVDFSLKLADDVPSMGGELFRPRAHFSAQRGWINDPNGLVFYEGKYHLFFQHNPVGMQWGNMHWGHAVSGDLMHWEQVEEALFPDEKGVMYSGSAVIDTDNRTGLKVNEHDPLLLYYTAAGGQSLLAEGQQYTQCLAYSVDGGVTFQKYAGNPVLPHIEGGNRDPKIVFCDELNAHVMALYLDGDRYALLRSDDLLHWEMMQQLSLPGDNECPDFYPLALEGERYWVLSGASDCYLIGKIADGRFEPIQPVRQLGASGRNAYAAQTFWQLPDHRRVRISWNTFELRGMPFNGSMTTPVEMILCRAADGGILLGCRPVGELELLHGACVEAMGGIRLPGAANDIRLRVPVAAGAVTLRLNGLEIAVDPAQGTVRTGKWSMSAAVRDGMLALRMVQDIHATEIFPEDGAGYLCVGHLADLSMQRLEAPDNVWIRAYSLKSIHTEV